MEQRQPLPRLGLGRRHLAATLTLAALAFVLVACDSGEGSPTPTGTPSPTARATESGGPPDGFGVYVAPTPPVRSVVRQVPTNQPSLYGFATIDLATGEEQLLYLGDDEDRFWYGNLYPALTADRRGIWVSLRDAPDATRYDLEGNVTDLVLGADHNGKVWDVLESADRSTLAFYIAADIGNLQQQRLTVTRGDEVHDLGKACCHALSPTGIVAYLRSSPDDGEEMTFEVFDPSTGVTAHVADGITLPGKDGTPRPRWSSSGRYVLKHDVDTTWEGDDPTSEVTYYIHDTETRAAWSTEPASWLTGPDGEDWLGSTEGADFVARDPLTGEVRARFSAPGMSVRGGHAGKHYLIATAQDEEGNRETIAFDLRTGQEMQRWPGEAQVVEAGSGLASVVEETVYERICSAIQADHPLRQMTIDCAGLTDVSFQWSPSGRYLTVMAREPGEPRYPEVYDMRTGDSITVEMTEVHLHWPADEGLLVITWGGGL